MRNFKLISLIILFFLLPGMLLSGCNFIGLLYPQATPTPLPAPTQGPKKELSICLGSEPQSLFLYKAVSSDERAVLQAITDGPIDITQNGEARAVLLDALPSEDNGTVTRTPIDMVAGDPVIDSTGNLVTLETGVRIFPSGCTSADCVVSWDGVSALQLDQLSADFSLKEGLKWSDGTALTAEDSVFSFSVAADPVTPVNKHLVDLTERYQALDTVTIEWKAVPGLVTDDLASFFWPPLPSQALADISTSELLDDENANRTPLSYGPFMIEEWQPGSYIRLVRNPNYHRAGEGLPASDILTYQFLSADDPASLLTAAEAECDIVTPSAIDLDNVQFITENAVNYGMRSELLLADTLEMLAIGITPSSYDDNYYPYGADRPDLFGDSRTRQALAYCIDQQTLVNKLLGGSVMAAEGLLSPDHPLMIGVPSENYSYDPTRGKSLLEEVGWVDGDLNPETPITAFSVYNVPVGTSFEVDLLTSQSPLRAEIANEIAADLSDCGVKVNITQLPLADLYQQAPNGPIFGRNFDLALISIKTGDNLDCRWFSSFEIPTQENYWLGETTGGANFYGYRNENFDAQCQQYRESGLNQDKEVSALESVISTLNNDLPFIPLYHPSRVMLLQNDVCGIPAELKLEDLFLFIEEISSGDGC